MYKHYLNCNISPHSLTFGTDPEVAAYYMKDDTMYVQPAPFFRKELGLEAQKPNSKHPVYLEEYGIVVMEDGVAFEFTIPPTSDPRSMYDHIQDAKSMLDSILSPVGHQFVVLPTLNYEIERFLTVDDEYKMCLIFGCDPDKDAILPDYVCQVIDALQHPYRYFGGHFQIGCSNPVGTRLIHTYYEPFIKLLAVFLGNLVTSRNSKPELERIRAKLYGQPGRYRLQPWGIEYRTPSNNWIDSVTTMRQMFEAAKTAFMLLQNPKQGKEVINEYLPSTIDAITRADTKLAQSILDSVRNDYEF